jgi:tRNA-splicing ligase RtcB
VLRSNLHHKEIQPKMREIVDTLAREVPSGVGCEGTLSLSSSDLDKLMIKGAKWAVEHGYGDQDDILHTEENGALEGADPSLVSRHAKERGAGQQGTLGSGNHFLEVQAVEEIFDEKAANTFGLFKDQVVIMIHSGSRGFGHQVCADYITIMNQAVRKYNLFLPDRQLCCAPVNSPEGKNYFAAMAAAANYAWANRQMLMHWTRDSFAKVLRSSPGGLGMSLLYDVAHNIAKLEKHRVDGQEKLLCVHRKGATRAFPGDPVLIPGDMGRYSYVLVGTQKAMEESWGSVCHGAGRLMSRAAAVRKYSANQLLADLEKKGILVRSASRKGLVEEAPGAYKDVREVVDVVHNSGLAKKVARMRPLGVVKG